MPYKTNVAISYLGDRVPKGTVIEMDKETAKNLGDDVTFVAGEGEEETEEEVVEEKPLEEMSLAELKAKAETLGLAKSGSMADLKERITLHLQGGGEEETEEE